LEGLLLSKEGISKIEIQFSICKLCYVCLKNKKMSKLALVNGLWIGIAPMVLPKLTMVEETLMTHYRCRTIMVKLRYNNRRNTTGQHELKGNIVSFAQDLESAMNF
jgi:hypothetical protein